MCRRRMWLAVPMQAIDLVDESAAKLKMEITSKPTHLDEIDRKILQLEMERLSLAKVRCCWWAAQPCCDGTPAPAHTTC